MPTEYVVFQQVQEGLWEPIGHVQARSARSAIQQRIDGMSQSSEYRGPGTYVAVPERSFRPLTVQVQTKTELKFS